MTEQEKIEFINMFLNAVVKSTGKSINKKFDWCISHFVNFQYVGSGEINDGLKLLENYYINHYKTKVIGYLCKNGFQEVYDNDMKEIKVSTKTFYDTKNIYWFMGNYVDDSPSLANFFILPNGKFHKAAMDSFVEVFNEFLGNRNVDLLCVQCPIENFVWGQWIDNSYYLLVRIQNINNYDFYLLECVAYG